MTKPKVGFYNPKVDNREILKDCCRIFYGWDELKKHLVSDDTIVFASKFSSFEIDLADLLSVLRTYRVEVYSCGEVVVNESEIGTLLIQTFFIHNEHIKENKKIISLLLE